MLKAENIVKFYDSAEGRTKVLDGLDFKANAGELCMITGPSGCGKSTLLNVLSCLDTFNSGELVICGRNIWDMTRSDVCRMRRRHTAFIFQGYNLISSMSATENVELGLKYRRVARSKRTQLARSALEDVGLGHRLDYLPHQLSGGQQQRVAIARALVLQPEILFCDEPTGNLDKASAAVVMEKIIQLKNSGTAVVMITHDYSLLGAADTVYTIKNGRLEKFTV